MLIRSDDVLTLYLDSEVDVATTITIEPIGDSVLSRLGGDEFIILLPDTRDRFAAGTVARRILKHLEQPIRVDGHEVFVTASIGIATFPEDGLVERDPDPQRGYRDVSREAAGQGGVPILLGRDERGLGRAPHARERSAARARGRQTLELHYQPQVEVRTGRIVGAEALLRWRHPERGYISPTTFIPIAEDSGLILPIGEWVLSRACRQAVEWQRLGLPEIPIAVNVSGVQFRRQDLCELVGTALEERPRSARCCGSRSPRR